MTHPMKRSRLVPAVLLGLAMLAACGYEQTAVPEAEPTPTPSAAAPTVPPECGEATASYAPKGALPAPDLLPAGSTMQDIQDRGRLIAGVSADTLLLGSRNPVEGRIEGFDIDMVNQVARAIFGPDITDRVTLRVITAAERLPVLQAGEVDIVVRNMTINCARWEDIAFSAEYYRSGQKILVRKGVEGTVTGIDTLADLRVCAPAGTSSYDNLLREAPDAVPISALNHTTCLLRFQQGDVDVITGDDTVLAGLAAQDPYAVVPEQERFTDEPYGIGMNADDVDLVQFVNQVLERMRADGSWQASYDQWLAEPLNVEAQQPQPIYGRPRP